MISPEWPPLSYSEWEATCDTLHMWTQIVGKTRLTLTPLQNHWWNVTLYVTPRGLTTSSIPFGRVSFKVDFDFLAHQLVIVTSEGTEFRMALYPRSVADFYREYMSGLRSLGIDVQIHATPDEFDDKTPFNQDEHHASYDAAYIERFRRVLINCDRIFKEVRSHFIGKASPVHFFWGSFDLAVSRFSGRRAPLAPDVDPLTREAFSHEYIGCGWWPGDRRYPNAAFYSYTAPKPAGLEAEAVRPTAAHWDPKMGEFLMRYDEVRASASPAQAIMDFCQSTYEAGAKLAGWDRKELEREDRA